MVVHRARRRRLGYQWQVLLLLNKPFDVLPQFTDPHGRRTLAELVDVPGVYAAGRLDRDSEGLMVLTDDGRVQHQLSHPRSGKEKRYWVQVEGNPTPAALAALRAGLVLADGPTLPAWVELIEPPTLWERDPPIRVRKAIPTSWLDLGVREGRNRQVRRMTAAVGFPTLRLVRHRVGPYQLGDLQPGQWRLVER